MVEMIEILKKRRLSALDAIENGYKPIQPRYPRIEGNEVNIATTERDTDENGNVSYRYYTANRFTDEELDVIFNEYHDYSSALVVALEKATHLINKSKTFKRKVFWGGKLARSRIIKNVKDTIDDVFYLYENLYVIHRRTNIMPQEIDKFLASINGGYSVLDVVPEPLVGDAYGKMFFRYGDRTYHSITVMELWQQRTIAQVGDYETLWQWAGNRAKRLRVKIKNSFSSIKRLFKGPEQKQLAPSPITFSDKRVIAYGDYDYDYDYESDAGRQNLGVVVADLDDVEQINKVFDEANKVINEAKDTIAKIENSEK